MTWTWITARARHVRHRSLTTILTRMLTTNQNLVQARRRRRSSRHQDRNVGPMDVRMRAGTTTRAGKVVEPATGCITIVNAGEPAVAVAIVVAGDGDAVGRTGKKGMRHVGRKTVVPAVPDRYRLPRRLLRKH
jgi:hypothetical protein